MVIHPFWPRARIVGIALLICATTGYGQKGGEKTGLVAAGTAEERAAVLRLVMLPEKNDGMIRLPLRVIIARDLAMEKMGVSMTCWVEAADFKRLALPEINRIWAPAKVEWVIESVIDHHIAAEVVATRREDLEKILASHRDGPGESDQQRVPRIKSFFDPGLAHPVIQNLFLFPFLGSTFQGVAAMGGNWAFAGMWTDKASRGLKPPQQALLAEPLPFHIGSLGRTCAHELGHNLKLVHPDKSEDSPLARLMGGRRQGYDLTPGEITTARATALARAQSIQKWATQR